MTGNLMKLELVIHGLKTHVIIMLRLTKAFIITFSQTTFRLSILRLTTLKRFVTVRHLYPIFTFLTFSNFAPLLRQAHQYWYDRLAETTSPRKLCQKSFKSLSKIVFFQFSFCLSILSVSVSSFKIVSCFKLHNDTKNVTQL